MVLSLKIMRGSRMSGGGGGAGISMFVKEGPSHIFILYYFLYYFYIILVLYHKYVISDSDRSRLTILSHTCMLSIFKTVTYYMV